MPASRSVPAKCTAVLSCLFAVLALLTPPAAAAPPPSHGSAGEPADVTATVTLVTGDIVTLRPRAGDTPVVSMKPAEGPDTGSSFRTLELDGDTYVVPGDVAGLVPDVLDLELFNVTELVAMGYHDAAIDVVPLIVQGPRPLAALPTARGARPLPSIGATALALPKAAADGFGETLSGRQGLRGTGIGKVWLDRKVYADELDPNLTRIGAPQAWKSGLSGAGVDVAVLDTGVDTTHPDLRGRVAVEANFTTEASAGDGNGHGTHVASILGGSGAAAHGARRGVAFDSRLLSGKVLGSDGKGQASWVIAGMQWAAEQGADVVNLSLGARAGHGDDPVAQALDALTASTGALFVVAAGNSGAGAIPSIETPGIAASALTVGNAGPDGKPVFSSSNGPTDATYRSKPDLTAPGVGIVGARAGGGDANPYVAMSGTSQATPHVAGAAALLRQQHPDWNWQQIKTALMVSADTQIPEPMPYEEGAGLLDLAAATTETLRLNRGNVDFGYLRYPDATEPMTIELELRNNGRQPQIVHLADSATSRLGDALPDNAVTLSSTEVTVAPGTSEQVTATLTPAEVEPGVYSGHVRLTRAGHDPIDLPLSFYAEAPRHDVRLTVLDRHGQPYAGGSVWLGNTQRMSRPTGGGFTIVPLDENGQGTGRLAPGPISAMARVETPATDDEPATVAFAGSPEVMLDRDISLTIDARRAQPLQPATVEGADTTVHRASVHYVHVDAAGTNRIGATIYATGEDITHQRLFLQPTAPVRHGNAVIETRWELDAKGERHGRQADVYHLVLGGPTIPDPPVYRVPRQQVRDLARLESDYTAPTGAAGTSVETWEAVTELVNGTVVFERPLPVPRKRVEMVTARPGVRWRQCVTGPDPVAARLCSPSTAYRAGERRSPSWFRSATPAVFDAAHSADRLMLPVALADGEHWGSVLELDAMGTQSLRLFRNGVELPRVPLSNYFDSPPEPAMFRLEHSARPDPARLPIGSEVRTAWTFPSQAPTDPAQWSTSPRLLSLQYRPRTDARGTLPEWRPLVSTIRMVSVANWLETPRVERGSLRMWASTDHGKRWHEAVVVPLPDGSFFTIVPRLFPRSGGTVSVRVEGKAAEGRAIEQTIIDAYPVR
jgi:subtilisin family serine protease